MDYAISEGDKAIFTLSRGEQIEVVLLPGGRALQVVSWRVQLAILPAASNRVRIRTGELVDQA